MKEHHDLRPAVVSLLGVLLREQPAGPLAELLGGLLCAIDRPANDGTAGGPAEDPAELCQVCGGRRPAAGGPCRFCGSNVWIDRGGKITIDAELID